MVDIEFTTDPEGRFHETWKLECQGCGRKFDRFTDAIAAMPKRAET
jgi:hypothetical protein